MPLKSWSFLQTAPSFLCFSRFAFFTTCWAQLRPNSDLAQQQYEVKSFNTFPSIQAKTLGIKQKIRSKQVLPPMLAWSVTWNVYMSHTDTCSVLVEWVLSQKHRDVTTKSLVYLSQSLTKTKKAFRITRQNLLTMLLVYDYVSSTF